MNYQQKIDLQKKIISDLAHSTNNFAVNCHNSFEHESAKLKEFMRLKQLGHKVLTEAKFKNGSGITDIIDLTTGIITEILWTETLEEAKKKVEKYPDYFEDIRFLKIRITRI